MPFISFRLGRILAFVVCFMLLASSFSTVRPAQADGGATFSGGGIAIPDVGEGTPYPSTITISGTTGTITKVTIVITNFTHSCPDDVDFLLVSPTGQNVNFFAQVGGCPRSNESATLTFDDNAGAPMGDVDASFKSGTYKVSHQFGRNTLPPPAPATSSASALSVFNGNSANGTWWLYVNDCCSGDSGSIQAWSITFSGITGGSSTSAYSDCSPYLSDGRVNNAPQYDCAAPVVIYCTKDGIDIYKTYKSSGYLIVRASKAEIDAGVPHGKAVTIKEDKTHNVLLSRLRSGEFQVNAYYDDGKPYVFAWDACPPTKIQHIQD